MVFKRDNQITNGTGGNIAIPEITIYKKLLTNHHDKKGIFKTRKRIQSFHSKKSSHVQRAKAMYNVDKITANSTLAKKTQCTRASLEAILRKGRGAYYSSGSRPNQTAESWARARLASAITHGKASLVDKDILLKGCKPSSPVF